MAAVHPTTNASINYHYWVAAFVVVLVALVAGSGLFFAVERIPSSATPAPLELRVSLDNDENNDGNVDSSVAHSEASSAPVRGVLDNDADNDAQDDGTADSLAVLHLVLLFVALVGGRLLLVLCEALKLSSAWVLGLERPG